MDSKPSLAEILLSDDLFHPVVSSLKRDGDQTTFWISERAEIPGQPTDHEDAEKHYLAIEVDTWMRNTQGLRLIGRLANSASGVLYQGITVGDRFYLGTSQALLDYLEKQ